jgi:hypothetical protein
MLRLREKEKRREGRPVKREGGGEREREDALLVNKRDRLVG